MTQKRIHKTGTKFGPKVIYEFEWVWKKNNSLIDIEIRMLKISWLTKTLKIFEKKKQKILLSLGKRWSQSFRFRKLSEYKLRCVWMWMNWIRGFEADKKQNEEEWEKNKLSFSISYKILNWICVRWRSCVLVRLPKKTKTNI